MVFFFFWQKIAVETQLLADPGNACFLVVGCLCILVFFIVTLNLASTLANLIYLNRAEVGVLCSAWGGGGHRFCQVTDERLDGRRRRNLMRRRNKPSQWVEE